MPMEHTTSASPYRLPLPSAHRFATIALAVLIAMPLCGATGAAPTSASKKSAGGSGGQSILVLVNDEPITAYEVEQRQRLMALGANFQERAQANFQRMIKAESTTTRLKAILNETINGNRGKTREQILAIFEDRKKQFALSLQRQAVADARASVLPALRKSALEELIDERLKLQEAKRLNLVVGDDEVSAVVNSIAQRNKMTEQQFGEHLKSSGADINAMRQRFKATLSWNNVIRRRFGHQIAITERDVDRFVDKSATGTQASVELKVQRITLAVDSALDQRQIASRLQQAEALRAKFTGCKDGAKLAESVAGARFEDLGTRSAGSIAEPTQSLLLNAKDGEALPATVGPGGVELWAVCGRQAAKADAKNDRDEDSAGDARQKEFEILAKKHLKDLRQDAFIEYR